MILDKKKTLYALIATILLQLTVLSMEYGNAVFPLLTGQEIKLKVVPVDPRSLFRGNYARLNYEISSVTVTVTDATRTLRKNEIVYVKLKQDGDGFYAADTASLIKPDDGLYMQGRTRGIGSGSVRVRYGIEAFFAPKEKALALEKDLRAGGVALVMVAKNGKSTLKGVVAKQ